MNPLIISKQRKHSPTRDMVTRLCLDQNQECTMIAWWSQEEYEEGFQAPAEQLFEHATVVFLCIDEHSTAGEGYVRSEAWARQIPVYSVLA